MRRSERIRRKSKPITPIKKSIPNPAKEVTITKAKRGGFYDREYKKLLIIPFVIFFIALITIGVQVATTGDFIHRGVSLKGGLLVTIPTSTVTAETLVRDLQAVFPSNDIEARTLEEGGSQIGVTITADIIPESQADIDKLISTLESSSSLPKTEFSIETIGSSLGEKFFQQTLQALFIAFIFMGFVVFLYFGEGALIKAISGVGTLITGLFMFSASSTLNILALIGGVALLYLYAQKSLPSVAVMLAAFSDIIITLAIVNIMGMKMSTAGIAAFLMLIGYSVDTDILLSTRVLKRTGGSVYDRVMSAVKTGLTMNITTIAAVGVALIFSQSEVISQIMTILLIGLVVDMMNTWIQNVGILRWYLAKKEEKKQ